MLNDACASRFKKVYLAPGFTDLRRGIDGLASIVRFQYTLDPYDKNTLFLFCGRRNDRIKALLWEGDGFLLLYKRLDNGTFRWPRTADEAMAITDDQYRMLMQGLEIIARHPITEVTKTPDLMRIVQNAENKKIYKVPWQWIKRRCMCLSTKIMPGQHTAETDPESCVDNPSVKPLDNSFSDGLSTVILPDRQRGSISVHTENLL